MAKRLLAEEFLTPDTLKNIADLLANGKSDKDIFKAYESVGLKPRTYKAWKKSRPELAAIYDRVSELKEEKIEEVNMKLEEEVKKLLPEIWDAIKKLIKGYKATEARTKRYKLNGRVIDDDPKFPIEEIITVKDIQPNVTFIIFMLKCIFGWTEKSVVEMQGQPDNVMTGLTTEELRKLVNIYGKDKN